MRASERIARTLAAIRRRWERARYRRRITDWEWTVLDADPRLARRLDLDQAVAYAQELVELAGGGFTVTGRINANARHPGALLFRRDLEFPLDGAITVRIVAHETAHLVAYHRDRDPAHGRAWWAWYARFLEHALGGRDAAQYVLRERARFGISA